MKPMIIYVDGTDDFITLTREKFEELINEAYENGKKDASSTTQYVPYYPIAYPITCPTITYGVDSGRILDVTPVITCKNNAELK